VSDAEIRQRLRQIREATGLTQLRFLPHLNAAAVHLGVREYSQSTLSKLESGPQAPSFDDIAVFAAVDPEGRGKLWLAWGETADATLRPPTIEEIAALTGARVGKPGQTLAEWTRQQELEKKKAARGGGQKGA
jgi:transcriptional regulator with XRE-family HTH domain